MRTVEQTARLLADEHSADDADVKRILWAPADAEVLLVEVSSAISNDGEVFPFRFSPDGDDVPYESVIVVMSPADWGRVEAGKLALPAMFGEPGALKQLYPANAG